MKWYILSLYKLRKQYLITFKIKKITYILHRPAVQIYLGLIASIKKGRLRNFKRKGVNPLTLTDMEDLAANFN